MVISRMVSDPLRVDQDPGPNLDIGLKLDLDLGLNLDLGLGLNLDLDLGLGRKLDPRNTHKNTHTPTQTYKHACIKRI